MKKLYVIIVVCVVCHLLPAHAQQQYYPDGTRWGRVWVNRRGLINIDSTYTVHYSEKSNSTMYSEYVVEGTTVVPMSETESVTCQVANRYDYNFNNELINKGYVLFRQSGDSVFVYDNFNNKSPYYTEQLHYTFCPWIIGDTVVTAYPFKTPVTSERLEHRKLADGNEYDYLNYSFRTIGRVFNGILPSSGFARSPTFIAVTHFIRNNTLIYQNNNLIWPEGYTTQIHHPFNDFTAEGRPVYSLQGLVVGNSRNLDALPRGIYIVNGKKIYVGR
jgi:hypothetical protein